MADLLVDSTTDDVSLSNAVEQRFCELSESYIRVKGITIPIPASIQQDMMRWREMVVRHRTGDLRHKESEIKALRSVAQWTVDENCKLRNQPLKKVQWEPQ